jgi:hypothetical protein
MRDKLVEYKTAKLLKEKGFNENCEYSFTKNGTSIHLTWMDIDCSQPTQALAQKWLREIHGIHIVIIPTVTSHWTYKTVRVIAEIDNNVLKDLKFIDSLPPYNEVSGEDFQTYGDALEDAIFESLKIISVF